MHGAAVPSAGGRCPSATGVRGNQHIDEHGYRWIKQARCHGTEDGYSNHPIPERPWIVARWPHCRGNSGPSAGGRYGPSHGSEHDPLLSRQGRRHVGHRVAPRPLVEQRLGAPVTSPLGHRLRSSIRIIPSPVTGPRLHAATRLGVDQGPGVQRAHARGAQTCLRRLTGAEMERGCQRRAEPALTPSRGLATPYTWTVRYRAEPSRLTRSSREVPALCCSTARRRSSTLLTGCRLTSVMTSPERMPA